MDPNLTLKTAKESIRHREAVHEQQQTLKNITDGNLDAIRPHRPLNPGDNRRRNRANTSDRRDQQRENRRHTKPRPNQTQLDGKSCTRCSRERHPRDKCPAKDVQCHNCQRKGHYSAQCFRRTVSTVQDGDTLDSAFLDTVSTQRSNAWFSTISVNGRKLPFKLDTGAEVTAVSKATWQEIGKPLLQPLDKKLFGPACQPLEVLGHFLGHLTYQGREARHQVFIVNHLKTNLLGLLSISALHLAARVNSTTCYVTTTEEIIKRKFPKVFTGLGNLGDEYDIKLRPDAKPYSLFTPRHVPLPLHPKVMEELDRMEREGVISKVREPTPWCAGIVVVLKKSGNVHICVDLKPLNESVLREVHPLPMVDDTLAYLAGARVFSKLDANSGFWQIPLSQSSRLLTTFITPTGRYCFNKLPFGISSAPEHFQRRMSELLEGLYTRSPLSHGRHPSLRT